MLHLGILVENMRREGFEFQIGPPKVILKEAGGKKLEPFDEATVDVPEEYVGAAVDLFGSRKGTMQNMVTENVSFQVYPQHPCVASELMGVDVSAGTSMVGDNLIAYRVKAE